MTVSARVRGETPSYSAHQLQQRLPNISPEVAGLVNRLLRAPQEAVVAADAGGERTRWRVSHAGATRPAQWYILEGAREEIGVAVTSDRWAAELGERAWQDYAGDARLLAWTLVHGQFVDHLGELIGDRLTIRRSVTSLPPNLRPVRLGFRTTGAPGELAGMLAMGRGALAALVEHPAWQAAEAVPSPAARRVPIRIQIGLPPINLDRRTVRACRLGDVIVIGRAAACWSGLRLSTVGTGGRWQWHATYDNCALTVGGRIASRRATNPEESDMADQSTGTGSTDAVGHTPDEVQAGEDMPSPGETPGSIDQVPVGMTFDLGRIEISLADLETVQPGYVFELNQPLESATVRVRANGRTIGEGELVVVGDQLGVRLTDLAGSDSR